MSLRENDTSVDEKAIEDGFPSIDVTSDIEVKEPPDGGWVAWLVVFGCFCVCMLKYHHQQLIQNCGIRTY